MSVSSAPSPQPAQPTQPPSADDLRDQAREAAYGLAAGIGDALRELRAEDYAAALPAAWEDMQRAFDTLYTTLGGRRNLGDYPPDPFNTRRDVTQVAMRLILLLRAVERMTW